MRTNHVRSKPVRGFPGYTIYSDGRLYSEPRQRGRNRPGQFIAPAVLSSGHCLYLLYKKGRPFCRVAQRLVLEAFGPRRKPGERCCHLDGNPKNNDVTNLCWRPRVQSKPVRRRRRA